MTAHGLSLRPTPYAPLPFGALSQTFHRYQCESTVIIEPMGHRDFVRTPLAALAVAMMVSVWPIREGRAQTTNAAKPIEGAWTLNRELSDSPQDGASGARESGGDHGGNRG